jgi:hypothetical protein
MSRPLPPLLLSASLVFAATSPIYGEPAKPGETHGSAASEGRTLQRHQGEVMAIAFSPDGKLLASAGTDGHLMISATATGKVLLDRMAHDGGGYAVAFAPDGKLLATAGVGGRIRLWDMAALKEVRSIELPAATLSALAFSPDGKTLACGDYDKGVSLWDAATCRRRWQATGTGRVTSLAFTPDGKSLVSGGATLERVLGMLLGLGDGVTFWSTATGRKMRSIPGRGTTIAIAGDGSVIAGGAVVPDVRPYKGGYASVVIGGKVLGAYDVIRVWEVSTGDEVTSIPWCGSGIALTPDGLLVASCAGSLHHLDPLRVFNPKGERTAYTLRLWDSATAVAVARFPVEDATVVAFSADGRMLAAARREGQVLVWDVLAQGGKPGAGAAKGLEALWVDLGGDDTKDAFRARCVLSRMGDKAAEYLASRVKLTMGPEVGKVREQVKRLDADDYEKREAAQKALKEMGPIVAPLLRQALEEKPSAEARRRIQELLSVWRGLKPSPEELRALRGVAVLEAIGTPKAREALEKLAKGPASARLTAAAKAALTRLERMPSARP